MCQASTDGYSHTHNDSMHLNFVLRLLLTLTLSVWLTSQAAAEVDEQRLPTAWEFRQSGTEKWAPASVPGCVHTDLIAVGRIDDPSYRLNEKSQQWVGYADWEYQTTFQIDEQTLDKRNVRLVFEGLDTYADVYLNGELLLSADNMFRTWKVDCKKQLRTGENRLRIYFRNVFAKALQSVEATPLLLQAFTNNDQAKVKVNMHNRKAGFHFGWDWGPRLVTCGVWRPIRLQSWDEVLIESTFYEQTSITAERAEITAHVELHDPPTGPVEVVVRHGESELARESVMPDPGKRSIDIDFSIDEPMLWWTHDLGEQPLYDFATEVRTATGGVDQRSTSVGLRDLKVVRDRDEHGRSMSIVLNGVPLFVKGANYIPQDNFQSRVTEAGYRDIIGSAREANMNMLRVWGGGIYEEDFFYDLCDRQGVLVWQDTMFACAMYPWDEAFLANVRAEVIDNAKRLRNHPSVALYCGNNEVEISWYEWGWKDKYRKEEQAEYEAGLRRLFYETIPVALAEADPTRYYHPSSPITGYSDRPLHDGDVHYWGVWHGKEPFEDFDKNVGRFMSEYGFQSYPDIKTVSQYTEPADRSLDSEVMHAHQRSMADEGRDVDYGNRLINKYLRQYFPEPRDFASHLRMTQLVQAYGVQAAIESHRRRKPYCMGTLYWQINDCWPVASWSSIDYYGNWKALHYIVKRVYQRTALSTVQLDDEVEVYAVSDHVGSDISATLQLEVCDFDGEQLWADSFPVLVSADEGRHLATLPMHEFSDRPRGEQFLSIQLLVDGESVASATHCFVPPKHLNLKDPQISSSTKRTDHGYEITLRATHFASYAFIETADSHGRLSSNFIDLHPGRNYTIHLETDRTLKEHGGLVVRSLYDIMARPDGPPPSTQLLRNASSDTEAVDRQR